MVVVVSALVEARWLCMLVVALVVGGVGLVGVVELVVDDVVEDVGG